MDKSCSQCGDNRVRILHMVQSAEKMSKSIWEANQLIARYELEASAKTIESNNLRELINSESALHLKEKETFAGRIAVLEDSLLESARLKQGLLDIIDCLEQKIQKQDIDRRINRYGIIRWFHNNSKHSSHVNK